MKSLDNFAALELNNVEELKGGCAPSWTPAYNPYSNCYNPCNPCNMVTKKTKKTKKSKKSIKCGTKKKK